MDLEGDASSVRLLHFTIFVLLTISSLPILLPVSQLTDAEIYRTFKEFGPTPRIVRLLSEPVGLKQYKRALDTAISEITPDKLRKIVSDAWSLSQDGSGISNKLGLISRMERDDVSSAHVVAPITRSVKSGLAHQLRNCLHESTD